MDLQWRASLSKAEEQFLSLIEHCVFSSEYDAALKTMLRNRRDAENTFATALLSAIVAELDESLAEQAKPDPGGCAPGEEDEDEDDDAPQDLDDMPELPEMVQTDVAKIAAKSADNSAQIGSFVQACWRKVDTHCVLLTETTGAPSIMDRLKDTQVNALRMEAQAQDPNEKRYILLIYDLKAAGEASPHAMTRPAPLRGNGDHLKTFLRAALDAGGSADILDRDMFMLFDGGRAGAAPHSQQLGLISERLFAFSKPFQSGLCFFKAISEWLFAFSMSFQSGCLLFQSHCGSPGQGGPLLRAGPGAVN